MLLAQGKHDDALELLDVAEAGCVRADVPRHPRRHLCGQGRRRAAAREYDSALAANATVESGIDRAYVELKRDALPCDDSGCAAASAAPAAASGVGGR